MKKFILLISDGNGAASRGLDDDTLYTFECEADNINDAIDNCQEEIRQIDRFDSFDDYLKDELESTYHEYFNHLDPSGGDIFLVAHFEDDNLIEDTDLDSWRETGCYRFDNPEMADKFGMEAEAGDYREEVFNKLMKQYGSDDVPEDDTEDYEDNILRSNDDIKPDDTENESLNEQVEEFKILYHAEGLDHGWFEKEFPTLRLEDSDKWYLKWVVGPKADLERFAQVINDDLTNVYAKEIPEYWKIKEEKGWEEAAKWLHSQIEEYADIADDILLASEIIPYETNESLKEVLSEAVEGEIPWVLQQGEDGEFEYLGFAKSENDMIDKMVKDHRSDYIYEETYISPLEKDIYLDMKKDGYFSNEEIEELDKFFGISEGLTEEENIADQPFNEPTIKDARDANVDKDEFFAFIDDLLYDFPLEEAEAEVGGKDPVGIYEYYKGIVKEWNFKLNRSQWEYLETLINDYCLNE